MYDKNDIITEVFRSKGIIVGSSTINNGILSSIAAVLEMIKGLKHFYMNGGVCSADRY